MNVSQFKTFGKFSLLVSSILFLHLTLADANELATFQAPRPITLTKNKTVPMAFDEAVITILDTKKRHFTESMTAPDLAAKKVELRQGPSQKPMGGSSDGGGNAVENQLFDFYENQGTLEITAKELISLEPFSVNILRSLNDQFAGVDNIYSGGLGEIVTKALAQKKIYLESKPIISDACINQSIVGVSTQKVVACQSDLEVRFDVRWLRQAKPQDRAGLILHEMLLAWTRDRTKDPKHILEQKVRIVNRMIFDRSLNRETLQEYFGARAYTTNQLQRATEIAVSIKNFEAENYDLLREPSNKQLRLIFNGLKDGSMNETFCEFFVTNLRGTRIYPTLQLSHLATPEELCFSAAE